MTAQPLAAGAASLIVHETSIGFQLRSSEMLIDLEGDRFFSSGGAAC